MSQIVEITGRISEDKKYISIHVNEDSIVLTKLELERLIPALQNIVTKMVESKETLVEESNSNVS